MDRYYKMVQGRPSLQADGSLSNMYYKECTDEVKALLATERRRVIREEMRAIDKANTDNGINFYTSDKKVNNGWKTMREYTKWRIKFAEKTKP